MKTSLPLFFLSVCILYSCSRHEEQPFNEFISLQIVSIHVGSRILSFEEINLGLPLDQPAVFRFSQSLDTSTVRSNILLADKTGKALHLDYSYLDDNKTVSAKPTVLLDENSLYTIRIGNELRGSNNEKFPGMAVEFYTLNPPLTVEKVLIDGMDATSQTRIMNISFNPEIAVYFSDTVSAHDIIQYTSITRGGLNYVFTISKPEDSVLVFQFIDKLPYYHKFRFVISDGFAEKIDKDFAGLEIEFYTQLDSTPKFPVVSDEELLTLVQQQTFRYFWDFGHPVSGMSRERNSSDQTVTSGGSGFGLMTIVAGIERGFISRSEGIARINKMVDFLGQADRFHGAWSHWLNGTTGKVIPFSAKDDGGDLVETSYMAMGLITVRQYLNPNDGTEKNLMDKINTLWETIEWDWYTQGQNSLTWHWSPNYGWDKNLKIRGWNEALITYIMAASSPTHPISREVYEQGWGGGANMINGREFYGINLPLGRDYGGPLFFEHYTFLGVDPRNLSDQFANYWVQAVNHTLINRMHCIKNSYHYVGYSENCWGLTASDGNQGYSAHSPTNDRGVISPTAALSSMPYTPEESLDAMRHFYYALGDRLWGPYGFYDAFNVTAGWFGTTNIAIDQGPIIIMIENYRTALLWDLFMSGPEIISGLTKLGFTGHQ